MDPIRGGTGRTAITDVRVFDGWGLTDLTTVVIEDGRIVDHGGDLSGATVVDGAGGTLLPGLIDAHVHVRSPEDLDRSRDAGVTTVLDMASWPTSLIDSLRHRPRRTDVRSAGAPASAPGGPHTTHMGFPPDSALAGPEQAEAFVAARAAEGADYVKLIVEDPSRMGPAALDQPRLDALVAAARARGLRTIAHASSPAATEMAVSAGVDIVTHVPIGRPLDADLVARMVAGGVAAVPTLTMMSAVADVLGRAPGGPPVDYARARASVAELHRQGVPVLAGTDANLDPGAPANVPHGVALHSELELLVDAGLSTIEALRAATVLPAEHFGLTDRGVIAPGRRADLVLLDGDPVADIRATRAIRAVWCAGIQAGI